MKKTLKLTTALGTATVALAFAVTAASADTSLVNTGNNAEVDTGVNQTTTVNVTNSNTATINQSSFSLANSGANSTSGNIGGGSITSGDAVTSSELEVAANQNRTEITMPSSTAGSGDLDVVNTGRNLDLDARNTYRTTVTSNSTNVLDSSQTSFGLVNSGFNHTEGNIRGGDIDSGNAGSQSVMSLEANVNQSELDLSGVNGNGGGDLSLVNTGRNADIDVSDRYTSTLNVYNFNSADVEQGSLGIANSGFNYAEGNVRGGDVTSGTALVSNDFGLLANRNASEINMGGFGASDADVDTVNTGHNLVLNSGVSVTTSVTATSTNSASGSQTSIDVSNSGANASNGNVNGGNSASGDAGVWSDFMSNVNWNSPMLF